MTITYILAASLVIIYVLDRNVFHAIDLLFSYLPTTVGGALIRFRLKAQLWLDRQALSNRGPVGYLWNQYTLWQIRRNPAYREFFQDRE